jgi:transposase InsO family protein
MQSSTDGQAIQRNWSKARLRRKRWPSGKPHDSREAEIVRTPHARYRFGARMLEPIIRVNLKSAYHISHAHISEGSRSGPWLYPMRELILDHESEFGAHKIHDDGSWNSEFNDHLDKYGIKPIVARAKDPQTNGKLEWFFGEYKRRGSAFLHLACLSIGVTIDLMEA